MEFNLADVFESLADAFPDRLAVVSGETRLTYGQLDARSDRLADALRARGVGPGDAIGLYLYNGHEYLEAMLAGWKLRARTVNVNYRYVAHELAYLVDDADLVALLFEPELAAVVEATPMPKVRVRLARGSDYERALAEARPVRIGGPRSERETFVLYTGGTTGMPKGVIWHHVDLFFAALQGGQPGGEPFRDPASMAPLLKEYGGGIHIHTAAPLIHGSSQLASWIAMMNGGLAGLVPGRSFDPERSLDLCAAEQIHTLNLVGDAMALPLVEAIEAEPDRWDLSALQVLSSAGALLSGPVRKRLEAAIPSAMVLNSFGSSETGHQGTAFYEDDQPIWIMDEGHTVVLDEGLEPVPPGSDRVGRIARFGHVPQGYHKDPEKSAATFVEKDGVRYVIPGDLARVAADGSLIFLGRGSVCINSGGEKVFAEEVEEVVKGHPAAFDCVVVGVPDPRWGQRVEALLTLRPGASVTADDLDAHCRRKLAGYKTPRAFHVVDDLNRQPSGKPDYRWAQATARALGEAGA